MKTIKRHTLFLTTACLAAASLSPAQQAPLEAVQACRALGDIPQVRACLQALREGAEAEQQRPQQGENALLRFLITEYLGLSPEQRAASAGVRRAFGEAMQPHRESLVAGFQAILGAARDGQPVDFLAEEQGRLMGEALKTLFQQRAQAKAALALTPEQEEKLDRILELTSGGPPRGGAPSGGFPGAAGGGMNGVFGGAVF